MPLISILYTGTSGRDGHDFLPATSVVVGFTGMILYSCSIKNFGWRLYIFGTTAIRRLELDHTSDEYMVTN
jgi:hypothetical protein